MAEWLLYEHDDGRHAAAPSAEAATFAKNDPAWHRVGPVEVPDECRDDDLWDAAKSKLQAGVPLSEKLHRFLMALAKPDTVHFYGDGFPRPTIQRAALAFLSDMVSGRLVVTDGVDVPLAPSIPATMFHDAGAIAQCFYCRRYTLDPKALSDRQPTCECGKKEGWSGSFKPPGPDAKWSGKAPAGVPACLCGQPISDECKAAGCCWDKEKNRG